jgi:hypothetical protein
VPSITAVQPVHVATWIEAATHDLAAPRVKQRLAALRHLFDWLANGQVVPVNPAGSVRRLGPACGDIRTNTGARSGRKNSVRRCRTSNADIAQDPSGICTGLR